MKKIRILMKKQHISSRICGSKDVLVCGLQVMLGVSMPGEEDEGDDALLVEQAAVQGVIRVSESVQAPQPTSTFWHH